MDGKPLFRPVEVEFYAGYTGFETPRTVIIDGEKIPLQQITPRGKILGLSETDPVREFDVLIGGRRARLRIHPDGKAEISGPDR